MVEIPVGVGQGVGRGHGCEGANHGDGQAVVVVVVGFRLEGKASVRRSGRNSARRGERLARSRGVGAIPIAERFILPVHSAVRVLPTASLLAVHLQCANRGDAHPPANVGPAKVPRFVRIAHRALRIEDRPLLDPFDIDNDEEWFASIAERPYGTGAPEITGRAALDRRQRQRATEGEISSAPIRPAKVLRQGRAPDTCMSRERRHDPCGRGSRESWEQATPLR